MIKNRRPRVVRVIGHKNPDTDSICSAIAYAYLKNQISDTPHEARRAGHINQETRFVLKYFGVKKPRMSVDASPAIGNIDIRPEEGIDGEMSLRRAWQEMVDRDIDTLCITEPAAKEDPDADPEAEVLKGVITVRDITDANMDLFDKEILAKSATSCRNLVDVLQGELLCGDPDAVITKGRLGVGTSPEVMDGFIEPGDIMMVTNRYETQMCAIDNNVGYLILCAGAKMSDGMLARAKEKNITVIHTEYDTFGAVRLVSLAAPVRYFMTEDKLNVFNIHTPVEEAKKVMASTRHRYFPVENKDGYYVGVVSRRNLLNLHRKKFILVDHNEKTQAIEGLDEADILEIIDHHRIGNLETGLPVFFRNEPVGCTATIVYTMYREHNVDIPKDMAGLLLSAILSDTLIFHSPTCTSVDRNAAEALAKIAEVDIETYGRQMFEAGEDLSGKTADDILNTDFKEFALGEYKVSVGQGFYMSRKAFDEASAMVSGILPEVPARAGIDMVFYMATSIPAQGTRLQFAGTNAAEIVEQAFGVKPEADGSVWLENIVSRKKQLVPAIREKLLDQ